MKQDSKYLINEDPIFFLPSLAVGIGLNEAILLQKIHGWLQCTPKENVGRNWIYNTYKSWHEQLPFMSETTIKRAMKNLIDKGIVITENFNKKKFDKTLWYSIDYEKLAENVEITDSVKMDYRLGQNDTTIVSKWTNYTNNNNNNKENNNINIITKERFIKPTLEEVKEYCEERNNGIDAEMFINFYESKGWMVGKNKMKDWKACIRTWEKSRNTKVVYQEKPLPDWFGKEIQTQGVTKLEEEEMESILESFGGQ